MEDQKPFKFAFVGAGGVGKDTLIEECKVQLAGADGCLFVPEAAEAYFTANPLPLEQRFLTETQGEIQMLQKQFEDERHAQNPELMGCNRSVLDAAVYARAYGDVEGSERLFQRVVGWDWLPTYSRIFLLDPVGVPFVRTDIRLEDVTFRDKLHQAYLDFFEEKQIPYHLLSGAVQDRVHQVLQAVFMR